MQFDVVVVRHHGSAEIVGDERDDGVSPALGSGGRLLHASAGYGGILSGHLFRCHPVAECGIDDDVYLRVGVLLAQRFHGRFQLSELGRSSAVYSPLHRGERPIHARLGSRLAHLD